MKTKKEKEEELNEQIGKIFRKKLPLSKRLTQIKLLIKSKKE
jgi:hypothetical protein